MSKESLKELRERLLRDERAQELIRMRAFEIYKLRGGSPGGEAHDWFQAESEVLTFLIEEEFCTDPDSQSGTAPTQQEGEASATAAVEPAKPARSAPKPGSARKTTAGTAEKKAPAKRASKRPAGSAKKPRGKTKKDS